MGNQPLAAYEASKQALTNATRRHFESEEGSLCIACLSPPSGRSDLLQQCADGLCAGCTHEQGRGVQKRVRCGHKQVKATQQRRLFGDQRKDGASESKVFKCAQRAKRTVGQEG